MVQPALLQLRARLERLDPPVQPVDVHVGAVEQRRDRRADLVAQRGLGRRQRGLRDQLVVLFVL